MVVTIPTKTAAQSAEARLRLNNRPRYKREFFVGWTSARVSIFRQVSGHAQLDRVQSVELKPVGIQMLPQGPLDQLLTAHFLPPHSLELTFADGQQYTLMVSMLGFPAGQIRWDTATPVATHEKMTVKTVRGELLPIDASTLRYHVDKAYAVEIDKAVAALQPTEEELAELSGPPPEWANDSRPVRELW